MEKYNHLNLDFESIADFIESITWGAEINFIWKGKMYAIDGCRAEGIAFSEGCYKKDGKYYNTESHEEYDISNETIYQTPEEVLDIDIEGDKLRDIITKVKVVGI